MYKRPLPRIKNDTDVHHSVKIAEGSFLYGLMNPEPTTCFKFYKGPVYKKEDYLRNLKKHYEFLGLKYVEPTLPDSTEIQEPYMMKEPVLGYADTVYVKMRVLKSGIVRIKLDASIATLHEKYYSRGNRPPVKNIIQAYKSTGFSDGFLEKIKMSFAKKVREQKRVEKIIDKIFNKEPVRKVKKRKEEEEEEEIVGDPNEDEEEKDDVPDEDEGMDVEPDADEDIEEPVDDEEYLSD
mgnify:CR=1 FL=1